MSINSAAPDGSPEAGPGSATVLATAPPSWPWRRTALFLAGAAQLITISAHPGDVVDRVREQLIAVLDLQKCRFEYGSLLGHPPRLEPDGTVLAGRGRWDVETAGLPGEEIELRVFSGGQYYGRFMMTPKPGSRPSLQARLVAVTLADQAGRALAAGTPASSSR